MMGIWTSVKIWVFSSATCLPVAFPASSPPYVDRHRCCQQFSPTFAGFITKIVHLRLQHDGHNAERRAFGVRKVRLVRLASAPHRCSRLRKTKKWMAFRQMFRDRERCLCRYNTKYNTRNLQLAELFESRSELQRRVDSQRCDRNEWQADHDDQLDVVTTTGQRVNVAAAHCTVDNVLRRLHPHDSL